MFSDDFRVVLGKCIEESLIATQISKFVYVKSCHETEHRL